MHLADCSTEISNLSAVDLARHIARRELSSSEVVDHFIHRIQRMNPRINAIVANTFDQARRDASEADRCSARGKPIGPLHGVPITIKELFDVRNTPTTGGIVGLSDQIASNDARIVQQLRDAGAIVLGKTNVPQTALMFESDNPLFGRSNNPWDLARTPGGSSGGEAAAIAARLSPLGIGSDLGGSIRQPAHACGIHGFKPTSGRLSMTGHWTYASFRTAWAQPGPMARHVSDIELAMQVLSHDELRRSPVCPPVDWNPIEALDPRELRVGYFTELNGLEVSPSLRRAVVETADALRNAGAHVVPFTPHSASEAWRVFLNQTYADGFFAIHQLIGKTNCDWRIKRMIQFARTPSALRAPMEWAMRVSGQRRFAECFKYVPDRILSLGQYHQLIHAEQTYRRLLLEQMKQDELQVLLCPPSVTPAPLHGISYTSLFAIYTALFNVVGFPAGTVSVTRVREGEETDRANSRDMIERFASKIEQFSTGLPVGVQVIGEPWMDEKVVAVMAWIEQHASESIPAPPES